ncbi:hypothetical protein LCGC14_1232340 [marine sediment metagenome]|uniref:Uncharacterized protein n=1 Tax=marine sediment metagenome TaxID=412755 RepID=A0A0F9LVE4_9ZZZZ
MLDRIGSCNHCGKCCQPPVVTENPCIERGQDRCKFYTDNDNGELYGHCLIYGGRQIKKVKDRFGKTITEAQIKWFNQNCIDYPLAEDCEASIYPPSECSFSFEVIDGSRKQISRNGNS